MTITQSERSVSSTGVIGTAAAFATASEAAQFLRLSRAMVHKLIAEGRVPACRYGRLVRIPWSWLKEQAQEVSR
jgi:excisionase family DNA binding protein